MKTNANKVHVAVTARGGYPARRATGLFCSKGYYGVFAGRYACGE